MKIIRVAFLLLLCCIYYSCKEEITQEYNKEDVLIIPEPAEMAILEGIFEFDENTSFVTASANQKELFKLLTDRFFSAAGFEPAIVSKVPKSNYVVFTTDSSLTKEAYELAVKPDYISITAKDATGHLYGLETLRQLLPPEIESKNLQHNFAWVIPQILIKDQPRYPWRGLMLDVSRHFFGKEYVLKTIERMALFKLNTLHLHLVDDQGWRIEIKKYPKLTAVGALRVDQEEKHWDARAKNIPGEKGTYGGFYTQEDIKEIVSYAKKHGIKVVPEIEMPAHVTSAIAAYPEFSCLEHPVAVPSGGLWPITDIYCAGKEETFKFLEDVLLEVMDLFPSQYIHIGGDEATRTNWDTCSDCQRRMKQENLKDTDELQSYFIKRIERFLSSKGRILIGWDEILEGGLAPGATVMSWRGIQGGWEASLEGHDVVMTPGTVYLNQYQGEPDYEPIAFGGYEPLNKVYHFDPVVDSMSVAQKKHILGSQANLWSEFVTNDQESEYMLYPRLTALAEALWTPKDKKDWKRYAAKIPTLFQRLDAMGITYARSSYAVTTKSKLNNQGGIAVTLQNEFPDSELRYALNADTLGKDSQVYSQSIMLNSTTILKAAVFEAGEIVGDTLTKVFNFHKAVGKKVTYEPIYNKRYQGTGADNMVNVFRGSKNFHDGQWQAWLEDDAEITIDMGDATEISSVALGTMENQGSGIYYPTKIKISISDDGKNFTEVGLVKRDYKSNRSVGLKDFKVDFSSTKTKWVRLNITNLAHPPTGGSSFMFLDEISIE